MLDNAPLLTRNEKTIGNVTYEGYQIVCPDNLEGFIFSRFANQKVEIFLLHNDQEQMLDTQTCSNAENFGLALSRNIWREMELALQIMYGGVLVGSSYEWSEV